MCVCASQFDCKKENDLVKTHSEVLLNAALGNLPDLDGAVLGRRRDQVVCERKVRIESEKRKRKASKVRRKRGSERKK